VDDRSAASELGEGEHNSLRVIARESRRSSKTDAWCQTSPIRLAFAGCPACMRARHSYTHHDGPGRGIERDLGRSSSSRFAWRRVVVLRHHDERAGAADDVLAIVLAKARPADGCAPDSTQWRIAQDHQTVDRDAFRERVVARLTDVAAGIVGAVA